METTEIQIDRWLERGGKFFRAVARNPVVRGTLLARRLTDEELSRGWQLYTDLIGFGTQTQARAAYKETAAAQAINAIDAWDAPTYSAAHAVLDARYPAVSSFLFESLAATTGVAAVAGVQRFLDRLDQLSEGRASGAHPEEGRAALKLLATRKIVDAAKQSEMRSLIETARVRVKSSKRPKWTHIAKSSQKATSIGSTNGVRSRASPLPAETIASPSV